MGFLASYKSLGRLCGLQHGAKFVFVWVDQIGPTKWDVRLNWRAVGKGSVIALNNLVRELDLAGNEPLPGEQRLLLYMDTQEGARAEVLVCMRPCWRKGVVTNKVAIKADAGVCVALGPRYVRAMMDLAEGPVLAPALPGA